MRICTAFQLTIEGHPFHAVHEVGCAEHLKGVLEAGHCLNLRAGLRAAVRRAAAEYLGLHNNSVTPLASIISVCVNSNGGDR